jgi:hypothetical protein
MKASRTFALDPFACALASDSHASIRCSKKRARSARRMLSELVAMWRAAIGKKRSGSKLCSPSFPAPLFHTETPKPTHGVTKKPDLERLAVLLVDVEQGDHEQACNELAVSATHLRVLLHRGRHRLRRALDKAGVTHGGVPGSCERTWLRARYVLLSMRRCARPSTSCTG